MKKMLLLFISIFLLTGCDILKKEEKPDDYEKVKYYDGGHIDSEKIAYRNMLITTYDKFQEVVNHYNIKSEIKEENFNKYNYLVLIGEDRYCNGKIESLGGIKEEDNEIYVKFNINKTCNECAIEYYLYFVELDKNKYNEEKVVQYEYNPIKNIYCDK